MEFFLDCWFCCSCCCCCGGGGGGGGCSGAGAGEHLLNLGTGTVWPTGGLGRGAKYLVATGPASSSSMAVLVSWLRLVCALLAQRAGLGWTGEGGVVACAAVASTSRRRRVGVAAVYAGCGAAVVLPRSLRIKRGVGLLVSPISSWTSVLSGGAGIVSSLWLGGVDSGSSSDSRPESVSLSVSSPPCTSPSSSSTCPLPRLPLLLPDACCPTGTS